VELAVRQRARSAVAIAPPGLNTAAERAYQGVVIGTARMMLQALRPLYSA
jgi:hypothetical protein